MRAAGPLLAFPATAEADPGLDGSVRLTRLADINRSGAVKTVRAVVGRDNGAVLTVLDDNDNDNVFIFNHKHDKHYTKLAPALPIYGHRIGRPRARGTNGILSAAALDLLVLLVDIVSLRL